MSINGTNLTIAAPLKRHMIADYLKVGSNYYLMGTGFDTLNESYGAQANEKAYINDKEQSSTVTSYQREFSYNCDLISNQKAIMALREVGERGLTGTDAMFEYVRVDLFQPKTTGTSNTEFYARHFIVSAIPENEEGEGAAVITNTGKLKPFGDMTEGWFDVSDKSFDEDSTAYSTAAEATETTETVTETTETTGQGG